MSFRSRLLLFFTIIVVIPMVAVALVLFSLTADSETGKADAEIAQGMRAAFAMYGLGKRRLAAVGTPNVVAPAVATPTTRAGKRLGYVAVSVTPARDYVHE